MNIPETFPPATSVLFARGVIARLAIWATLRIAVKENWGGPGASSKRTWLASVIVDAFEEQKPIPDDQYIEELLLQVMSDEFETVIEDGSAEAVAVDIVRLWDETQIGKGDLVFNYEELAEKVRGKMPDVQEQVVSDDCDDLDDDDDDEDEEGDGEEAPRLVERPLSRQGIKQPEIDEHGFTMVKGKARR
jgi:pre-rRNA-processing protein TSR2